MQQKPGIDGSTQSRDVNGSDSSAAFAHRGWLGKTAFLEYISLVMKAVLGVF